MLPYRRDVLLLTGAEPPSPAARELAEALARASSTQMSVLRAGAGADPAEILAGIDRRHAAAIVADFDQGPLNSEEDLRRLVAAARCTVGGLGASRIRPARREPVN